MSTMQQAEAQSRVVTLSNASSHSWAARESLHVFLWILTDLTVLGGATFLALAHQPWFEFELGSALDVANTAAFSLALGVATVVCLYVAHQYDDRVRRGGLTARDWLSVAICMSAGSALATVFVFGLMDTEALPPLPLECWVLGIASLMAVRLLSVRLGLLGMQKGPPKAALLVTGGRSDMASSLLHGLTSSGYEVVGYVAHGAQFRAPSPDTPYLGDLPSLPRLVEELGVNELVVGLPMGEYRRIDNLVKQSWAPELDISWVLPPFDTTVYRPQVQVIDGVPLLTLRRRIHGFAYEVAKRFIDAAAALTILIVTAPLFGITALAILLEDGLPIIVSQRRVGRAGREFSMHKFRSMRKDADQRFEEVQHLNEVSGPLFKVRSDPRRTRVGRVIRALSIDELPQLFNVLLGHMSLVGPRPPLPREVRQYTTRMKRRLEVTPGITGLWQVNGRSELPFDQMLDLDIEYIERRSIWLDLKIMAKTIPAVLSRRGAY